MTTIRTDMLNEYVDGILDSTEQALLETELAKNSALRAEVQELQATSLLLSSLPELSPRRSFVLGAEFAKPAPISLKPASVALRLLPVIRTLSVAAALIFMVVAGSLFFDINGQSESNAAQTFQQQAVIMGETGNPSGASQFAEDESSAGQSSGELVARGDSASAAERPMEDLSAGAPEAEVANEKSVAAAPALPFGATEQGDNDHSNWLITSLVFGLVTIALSLFWLALSNTSRRDQA